MGKGGTGCDNVKRGCILKPPDLVTNAIRTRYKEILGQIMIQYRYKAIAHGGMMITYSHKLLLLVGDVPGDHLSKCISCCPARNMLDVLSYVLNKFRVTNNSNIFMTP